MAGFSPAGLSLAVRMVVDGKVELIVAVHVDGIVIAVTCKFCQDRSVLVTSRRKLDKTRGRREKV